MYTDPDDDEDYDNGYDDDPLDEYEAFDCGMDRDGNCGKAGSEECDWACPYSRDANLLGWRRGD